MPELPEVETVRRSAERFLIGRSVVAVTLRRRDIVTGSRRKPALLQGAVIAGVKRHGKNLAILAEDGRALGVHLGMTGQLLCLSAGARNTRPDHVHALWRVSPGPHEGGSGRLLFRDPRRFGGLRTHDSEAAMRTAVWDRLGPDAAEVTGAQLMASLGRSLRPVKAGLLDQAAVAGVGNIYADESLFAARIHPLRACCGLSDADWERLAAEVRRVLGEAIRAGGSTLRDYTDAEGQSGWFQTLHLVYGRGGLPCAACGRPLDRFTLAQRTTVACAACQPPPRVRLSN